VKARVKMFAMVWPVGRPPFHERPALNFRSNAELSFQMLAVARGHWPAPQDVAIDVHAQEIIVNGVVRGKFSLHEPRPARAADVALPGVGA